MALVAEWTVSLPVDPGRRGDGAEAATSDEVGRLIWGGVVAAGVLKAAASPAKSLKTCATASPGEAGTLVADRPVMRLAPAVAPLSLTLASFVVTPDPGVRRAPDPGATLARMAPAARILAVGRWRGLP